MALSKSDFDLSNPTVVVRILCGVLYVPHIMFKLNGIAGAAAFFAKAGFQPAMAFVVLAIATESICAIGLTFNLYTKWVGLMSAGTMVVAAYAVIATKGAGWLWNMGGVEYIVFWGVMSLSLALQAWRQELKSHGRVWLLNPPAHPA